MCIRDRLRTFPLSTSRSAKWGLRFDRVNRECYGRKTADAPERKTWGLHGTMRRNVVWNCNGVMVKGNNHTIEHNTIFATDPLNFESDGQPRDLALYSWSDFGTCQCTDTFCLALNETCCVPDDPNTYENLFSVCLLYTSPSPRDGLLSRMPSSA